MKIVYVLSSSESDFYTEEALVSMYSLKKHNPDVRITLVSDEDTLNSLQGKRGEIHKYIDDYVTLNLPAHFLPIQKSRYLKTSLRRIIDGTFLYIDNDTIITDTFNQDDICSSDIGAVFNQHKDDWTASQHFMTRTYRKQTGKELKDCQEIKHLFNGGVIFAKDTPKAHDFFNKWHELWMEDSFNFNYHKDQPSMWRANHLCGDILYPIEGIFNCQLIYPVNCLRYFFNAKILHYFSSAPMINHIKFKQPGELQYIRENGIDDKIKNDIVNLRKEYINGLHIYEDSEVQYYDTPLTILAVKISKMAPFINHSLRYIVKGYCKIFKKG